MKKGKYIVKIEKGNLQSLLTVFAPTDKPIPGMIKALAPHRQSYDDKMLIPRNLSNRDIVDLLFFGQEISINQLNSEKIEVEVFDDEVNFH